MYISLLISDLIILAIINYFAYTSCELRCSNKYHNSIIYIVLCLLICLSNVHGPTHITTLIAFFTFACLHFVLYKTNIYNSIFISILEVIIISTAEFISMLIMNMMFNLNQTTSITSFLYIFSLLFSNFIFFIIYYILMKFKKNISVFFKSKLIYPLSLLPIITLSTMIKIPNYFELIESNKIVVITFLLLTFFNFLTIYLVSKQLEFIKIKNDLKIDKEKTELQFKLYSKYYYQDFYLLHSLLHSYTKMKKLLDNKEYESLNFELDNLSDVTFKKFNSMFSESLLLNTIISNNVPILDQYNILIETKLLYSDFSFLEITDSSTFFSKIINYCIDSCKEFNKSTIYINSKLLNDKIILHFYFPSKKDLSKKISSDLDINKINQIYKIDPAHSFDYKNSIMHFIFIFNHYDS